MMLFTELLKNKYFEDFCFIDTFEWNAKRFQLISDLY